MLEDLMWVEKYRPTKLDEMALSAENRSLLEGYLEAGEIPHLLLCGPSGIGKTTLAKIITNELDCKMLLLNASNERGIDTIRTKVGNFVRGLMRGRWNIVVMDEFDAMTSDAQTALRNMMETNAEHARFILTANYLHKIIAPLQSRCVSIELEQMEFKERAQVLARVLKAEGIDYDAPTVLDFAERFSDLRQMLMQAQKSFLQTGKVAVPEKNQVEGAALLGLCRTGNYTALREVAKTEGFNPIEGLKEMFWAIEPGDNGAAQWSMILAKAVHESGWSPDNIILFLGTCAELIQAR